MLFIEMKLIVCMDEAQIVTHLNHPKISQGALLKITTSLKNTVHVSMQIKQSFNREQPNVKYLG